MAETLTDPLAIEVQRVLVTAGVPLTVEEIRARLGTWHHGHFAYGDVYNRLARLRTLGLCESMAMQASMGQRVRWYFAR